MAAYASTDDIAARLGRTLDSATEVARVQAFIEDVSALITNFCRRSFLPVPDAVKAVTCAEVIRILNSNPGVNAETVGDIQVTYDASTSVGLSHDAREVLEKYRIRLFSMPLESNSFIYTDVNPLP